MIDQHFQKALTQLKMPRKHWLKLLPVMFLLALSGYVTAEILHRTGVVGARLEISDEALGKLAAFAACSSGRSPAVEWDRAEQSISMLDYLLGDSREAMLTYFLSVIDTRKCAGTQTASTQHNKRVKL